MVLSIVIVVFKGYHYGNRYHYRLCLVVFSPPVLSPRFINLFIFY